MAERRGRPFAVSTAATTVVAVLAGALAIWAVVSAATAPSLAGTEFIHKGPVPAWDLRYETRERLWVYPKNPDRGISALPGPYSFGIQFEPVPGKVSEVWLNGILVYRSGHLIDAHLEVDAEGNWLFQYYQSGAQWSFINGEWVPVRLSGRVVDGRLHWVQEIDGKQCLVSIGKTVACAKYMRVTGNGIRVETHDSERVIEYPDGFRKSLPLELAGRTVTVVAIDASNRILLSFRGGNYFVLGREADIREAGRQRGRFRFRTDTFVFMETHRGRRRDLAILPGKSGEERLQQVPFWRRRLPFVFSAGMSEDIAVMPATYRVVCPRDTLSFEMETEHRIYTQRQMVLIKAVPRGSREAFVDCMSPDPQVVVVEVKIEGDLGPVTWIADAMRAKTLFAWFPVRRRQSGEFVSYFGREDLWIQSRKKESNFPDESSHFWVADPPYRAGTWKTE
jgi:hypothetical protein